MVPTGFKPVDVTHCDNTPLRNPAMPGGSESGALGDEKGLLNPDLPLVIAAWPSLPPGTREAVLAFVKAAQAK